MRVTFEACSPAWVTHAAHDLLDLSGVDTRTLDELDLDVPEQLRRVEARHPPVALPDRGADCFDDHRLGHDGSFLEARDSSAAGGRVRPGRVRSQYRTGSRTEVRRTPGGFAADPVVDQRFIRLVRVGSAIVTMS